MHRLGVWLIAIALVFNGATVVALWELPAASQFALAFHGEQHGHVAAEHNHDGLGSHKHADIMKCCGVCNIANLTLEIVATPITFAYASITFSMGQHHLVGSLVALDPDIPKAVV
jgi:hypothetical protein